MKSLKELASPDRDGFNQDPFGYSVLAWHKWCMAQAAAGFSVDPTQPPNGDDLKSPILWLAQANALSEAACALIKTRPNWESMPFSVKGVCDTQFCAVGLMLLGYSLEVCLKAMLILQKGVAEYSADEKKHRHHRLEELSGIVPGLTDKDKAMLRGLTHFVMWAGRYPDPGAGREGDVENIFSISEKYRISAKELFGLATRIMRHMETVVEQLPEA